MKKSSIRALVLFAITAFILASLFANKERPAKTEVQMKIAELCQENPDKKCWIKDLTDRQLMIESIEGYCRKSLESGFGCQL